MTDGFLFGCSVVDVTPSPGLPMAGYGSRKATAMAAHDALLAKASVCRVGEAEAALCAVDVVGFSREATHDMRQEIRERTGIPADRILIATSHTHSGPVTTTFRDSTPDAGYMAAARRGIATAVEQARDSLRPAKVGIAVAQAPQWHYNRRNEDQPIDDTLAVVRFLSVDGEPLATWLNFGCHPTIMGGDNLLYSRDWPGVACDAIEAELGGAASFFNGCHGDVGPDRPQRTFAQVEKIGRGVAQVALDAARQITFEVPGTVEAGQVYCRSALDDLPTLEQLRELAARTSGPTYEAEWARDQIREREAGAGPVDHVELEVQWFRIGSLCIACFPGQMFGAWGIELRERLPGRPLLIVNQANAHDGYFPTQIGFERGGYEARSAFMFNSNLSAPVTWDAGQRMVDAAVEALSLGSRL